MSRTSAVKARRLVLEIGEALHRVGTPAFRLEQVMSRVSEVEGLEGQFFCTPTSILASFGPLGDQRGGFVRVDPGSVDLGKLVRLDKAVQDLVVRDRSPDRALNDIHRILGEPARYSGLLIVLAFAVSSAAGACIFGGRWAEIGVAAFIGAVLGLLSRFMSRSTAPHLFEPVAATLAAAIAVAANALVLPLRVEIVTLAGVLYLLPGLTLTVAMTELATRNYAAGTARTTMAVLSLLQLAFGVALGSRLALLLPVSAPAGAHVPFPLWSSFVAIALAGLAFAVLFQALSRDVPWILLSVALAYAGSRLGTVAFGAQIGAFAGAVAVGMAASLYARLLDRPAQVVLVPGVLLLVPGSIGFRSVSGLLRGDTVVALDAAFDMLMVAVALAVGLLVSHVVLSPRRAL